MRSTVRTGRGRRLLGTALLVALPLGGVTACSEDEGVGEDSGIVEEEGVLEEEEDE